MPNWLLEPMYWNWLIFGVLLLVIEIAISGFFFLWPGIAALVVGLIYVVVPELPFEIALLLFAGLSIASVIAWRHYRRNNPIKEQEPGLNRRGNQMIGHTCALSHPIVNGSGQLAIDGSIWRVGGPDLAAGTHVKIVAIDGTRLIVEPLETIL